MFAIQEAKINANAKELCKENTRRAYEPKQKEFLEYCHHKFRNDDNSELITFEKVFGFMIYQCYRTKKDKKWVSGSRFRIADFNEVIGRVNLESEEIKTNLLDFNMINQYYCAIKDLLLTQNKENDNPLCKADLMTMKMKKLFTIVNGRKERKIN